MQYQVWYNDSVKSVFRHHAFIVVGFTSIFSFCPSLIGGDFLCLQNPAGYLAVYSSGYSASTATDAGVLIFEMEKPRQKAGLLFIPLRGYIPRCRLVDNGELYRFSPEH